MKYAPLTQQIQGETGVATLDATAFGKAAEGFVRISFTLSEQQIIDACERIRHFMQRFESPRVGGQRA